MITKPATSAGTIAKASVFRLLTTLFLVLSGCNANHASDRSDDFSVRDYGAVGDGRSDDAPAIRAAISAAATSGGGIVRFPAGTYRLAKAERGGQHLTLPSNVSLVSDEGAVLVESGHPSSPSDEWKKGPIVRINGASDCEIRGLHFRGPGQALYLRNSERITVRNCRFENHSPMAVYGDRTADVEVENCRFDAVGYGFYLRAPVRWRIRDSRFLANGRAIEAQGAVDCEVTGNFVDGKSPDGTIRGVVGFLFFPNSMASTFGGSSGVGSIVRKVSGLFSGSGMYGGASTVGNLIADNEVRNVREEGISLDCRGNAPKYYYGLPGMVATADANSFTDASHDAEELLPAPSCYVVILSGRGAGQYRLVQSVADKKLSISPAWDVIPDRTSRYCLLRAAVNNKIINNKVVNAKLGSIMLWGACLNNEVRGNIVVNSPSSGIQCSSLRPDVYKGMSRVLACFDNRILDNRVTGSGRQSNVTTSGIVLSNRYGGENEVQNYRNTVIGNVIENFRIGISVQAQNGAVIRNNTIRNCDLPIKRGSHVTNTTIE